MWGLPDGQMGNSEVGHLNIGAGRVVYQEFTRITKDINDGDFFKKKALCDVMEQCQSNRQGHPPDGACVRWRRAQPQHAPVRAFKDVQAATG